MSRGSANQLIHRDAKYIRNHLRVTCIAEAIIFVIFLFASLETNSD